MTRFPSSYNARCRHSEQIAMDMFRAGIHSADISPIVRMRNAQTCELGRNWVAIYFRTASGKLLATTHLKLDGDRKTELEAAHAWFQRVYPQYKDIYVLCHE